MISFLFHLFLVQQIPENYIKKIGCKTEHGFVSYLPLYRDEDEEDEDEASSSVCPYEKWDVYKPKNKKSSLIVYEDAFVTKKIDHIKPGEKYFIEYAEQHIRKIPAQVVSDHGDFKKGTLVAVLEYIGQGRYHILKGRNELSEVDATTEVLDPQEVLSKTVTATCEKPSDTCWLQILEGGKEESTTYLRVKTLREKSGYLKPN